MDDPSARSTRTDDTVHASYAYIDALGTNQHVVTFTKRVTRGARWPASLPQTSSSASSGLNSTRS
ncbi:hypothetical protein [Paenarthrobacter sp. YIM B13468]|uniref:hypothetical protein n=1 Tax=Paenarthrobacter sp. YIM B13468 TaxID=3366295 RepID=UPI00366C035C